ncbi:MAG: uL29 family ribosomal protein [Acidobacteriota bacterium]
MKKTAKELLKNLGTEEIENKVRAGAEQMFRIKFQMSMGQTEGIKKYRELRTERARLLTIRRASGILTPVVMSAPKGSVPAAKVKKAAKPRAKKA